MLVVEVTPRAAAQIEAAARWWVKNRPAAPDALRLDFQEAKEILPVSLVSERNRDRFATLSYVGSTCRESDTTSTMKCSQIGLSFSRSGIRAAERVQGCSS